MSSKPEDTINHCNITLFAVMLAEAIGVDRITPQENYGVRKVLNHMCFISK